MNDLSSTVQDMKQLIQAFVDERQWQQFHDAKNLSMSIAIETAELMEHFQWLRTDQVAAIPQDAAVMSEVQEEMADIFCYLLSLASTLEVDLCAALEAKMTKNRKKYPADQYRGRF